MNDNALLKLKLNDNKKTEANMRKRIEHLRTGLKEVFDELETVKPVDNIHLRNMILEIFAKDSDIMDEL